MVNYENWERYIRDLKKIETFIEDMIVAHEEVMSDRVYHALLTMLFLQFKQN